MRCLGSECGPSRRSSRLVYEIESIYFMTSSLIVSSWSFPPSPRMLCETRQIKLRSEPFTPWIVRRVNSIDSPRRRIQGFPSFSQLPLRLLLRTFPLSLPLSKLSKHLDWPIPPNHLLFLLGQQRQGFIQDEGFEWTELVVVMFYIF